MGQGQCIDCRVDELDEQFRRQFPSRVGEVMKRDQRIAAAKQRLDNEVASFRPTMGVQSQIVENVRDDASMLSQIVAQSQGAEGSLAAQQATNQTIATDTKRSDARRVGTECVSQCRSRWVQFYYSITPQQKPKQ